MQMAGNDVDHEGDVYRLGISSTYGAPMAIRCTKR